MKTERWRRIGAVQLLVLAGWLVVQSQAVCVMESDRGFKLACGFKQSGLFRIRNLGGVKGFFGAGFQIGDESGFKESLTNADARTSTSRTRFPAGQVKRYDVAPEITSKVGRAPTALDRRRYSPYHQQASYLRPGAHLSQLRRPSPYLDPLNAPPPPPPHLVEEGGPIMMVPMGPSSRKRQVSRPKDIQEQYQQHSPSPNRPQHYHHHHHHHHHHRMRPNRRQPVPPPLPHDSQPEHVMSVQKILHHDGHDHARPRKNKQRFGNNGLHEIQPNGHQRPLPNFRPMPGSKRTTTSRPVTHRQKVVRYKVTKKPAVHKDEDMVPSEDLPLPAVLYPVTSVVHQGVTNPERESLQVLQLMHQSLPATFDATTTTTTLPPWVPQRPTRSQQVRPGHPHYPAYKHEPKRNLESHRITQSTESTPIPDSNTRISIVTPNSVAVNPYRLPGLEESQSYRNATYMVNDHQFSYPKQQEEHRVYKRPMTHQEEPSVVYTKVEPPLQHHHFFEPQKLSAPPEAFSYENPPPKEPKSPMKHTAPFDDQDYFAMQSEDKRTDPAHYLKLKPVSNYREPLNEPAPQTKPEQLYSFQQNQYMGSVPIVTPQPPTTLSPQSHLHQYLKFPKQPPVFETEPKQVLHQLQQHHPSLTQMANQLNISDFAIQPSNLVYQGSTVIMPGQPVREEAQMVIPSNLLLHNNYQPVAQQTKLSPLDALGAFPVGFQQPSYLDLLRQPQDPLIPPFQTMPNTSPLRRPSLPSLPPLSASGIGGTSASAFQNLLKLFEKPTTTPPPLLPSIFGSQSSPIGSLLASFGKTPTPKTHKQGTPAVTPTPSTGSKQPGALPPEFRTMLAHAVMRNPELRKIILSTEKGASALRSALLAQQHEVQKQKQKEKQQQQQQQSKIPDMQSLASSVFPMLKQSASSLFESIVPPVSGPKKRSLDVRKAPDGFYPEGLRFSPEGKHMSMDTNFYCNQQEHFPGLYADEQLHCKVFHLCAKVQNKVVMKSFRCPEETIFDQEVLRCNWSLYVNCEESKDKYHFNKFLSQSYMFLKILGEFSSNYKKQA